MARQRIICTLVGVFVILMVTEMIYLSFIWPDWRQFGNGDLLESNVMRDYRKKQALQVELPVLKWKAIPGSQIPEFVRAIFITAEDSRFYSHSGIDWIAIKDAFLYNLNAGKIVLGASTISQQTVKNMFLSLSRSPIRKWHEAILTLFMEFNVDKSRILNTYLNIVELGYGIFGIEAAANHYWGKSASQITVENAAEMAASLPSPKKHNPLTRTSQFLERKQKILKASGYLQPRPDDLEQNPYGYLQPLTEDLLESADRKSTLDEVSPVGMTPSDIVVPDLVLEESQSVDSSSAEEGLNSQNHEDGIEEPVPHQMNEKRLEDDSFIPH